MIRLSDRVQIGNPPPGSVDPLGNPTPTAVDWNTAATEPALVQYLSTIENLSGGDVITARWRLTLCPVTTATGMSVVRWRGDDYQVDGGVQPVQDDRGLTHHHTAVLRRLQG